MSWKEERREKRRRGEGREGEEREEKERRGKEYLLLVCLWAACHHNLCSYLVIPAEPLPEAHQQPPGNKLSRLRELGVHDGHKASVDMCEGGRGRLGPDH